MSGTSTNVCIRIDTELKAQAEELFSEMGMNLTTAFNIFLRQAVRERRIPFEIRLERPNRETAAAIGAYLGFSSTAHFSRVFKKYAGVTPREYREKHQHS